MRAHEFLRVFSIQKSKHRFWIWIGNLITFQSLLTNLYQLITLKHPYALRKVNMRICAKNRKLCNFEARFLQNLFINGILDFNQWQNMVNPKGNWSLDYLVFLWRHQDTILWKHIFSFISTMKGWVLLVVGWMIVQNKWSIWPIKRMQCAHYVRNCASKFYYGLIKYTKCYLSGSCGNPSTDSARVWAAAKPTWVNGAMLIQQIQPVNAGPQSRPCSTYWDAHFSKMNAAWKIWQLLMRRLSTVQEPGQTYD